MTAFIWMVIIVAAIELLASLAWLAKSDYPTMTREDAAKLVLQANPTLAYKGKEQELEEAINRIMGSIGSGGGGFKVLGKE